ncbi:warthog protein 1-like [Orbicella faveolata]|uniref:warthog protein 1-like n=1 Tax=Orbicella faveolata TaxID=48498 RepID=UPI0009E4D280|nr:warthog protein 1-like [Orbicella faveolata]
MFIDKHGRHRDMSSMLVDDEVQVIVNNEIRFEPVITFIHRQPEVMQEFLQITTEKNNILRIIEDHLLFVEKTGKATAIPARDVKVGDILYVRADHGVEKDTVLNISKVYGKGVYAPVTLSGTILVNDVHTSCYFDVLSHEWSHRAMGVVRAVHYVSPWILQWISGVGRKDGISRLVQTGS